MKYQLISMRLGKDANKILKAYGKLESEMPIKVVQNELFVIIGNIKELTDALKQNVIVCHDENVIHIYDEKLK